LLLKQERLKRYNELALWFSTEYHKLVIKHNRKLNARACNKICVNEPPGIQASILPLFLQNGFL
jgi:hypothetical protein